MGEEREPMPELAEPRHQLLLLQRLQVGDGLQAALLHAPRRDRADTVDLAHRQRRQEVLGLGAADDREAARLLQLGGELGQELVAGKADRDRDADLVLDPPGDDRQRLGGRRRLGAIIVRQIEIGLVQRQRLDDGGRGLRRSPRISSLTRLYLAMSGWITVRIAGTSSIAWNIGMAERTPKVRAM